MSCSSCSCSSGLSSLFDAKQSQVYAQIGIAVQRKGLDAVKQQGESAVALIEAAAEIARELGQGTQVDTYA
jgi:hypothetical protein